MAEAASAQTEMAQTGHRADTAEIPRVTTETAQPTETKPTESAPAAETALATEGRPPLRRASARTGGIVTGTRPSSGSAPAGTRPPSDTRPPASARPPAGPAEAVRPARNPILPDPADVAAAPPLILPPDADVTLESPAAPGPAATAPAETTSHATAPHTTAATAPHGTAATAPHGTAATAPNGTAATASATTAPHAPSRGPDMHAPALHIPPADTAPDRLVPGMEDQPPPDETAKQRKTLQRRRLVMLLAFVLLAVLVLLVGQIVRDDDSRRITGTPVASVQPNAGAGIGAATTAPEAEANPTAGGAGTAQGTKAAEPTSTTPEDTAETSRPQAAAGAGEAESFNFAGGYGPVLGTSGTLRRFKVAVEKPMGNGGGFSMEVDRILADPRSWIASRQFRLQRVPRTAASEFTVYLAGAKTSEKMCAAGGLETEGFTSCRLPGQVIINWDRWQDAVPDYDAPLATYRAYAINHEVGHQLGHGHEGCPGKGKPAPVMMQQTYGLNGCVANSWPYINGKRYSGPGVN